VFCGDPLLLVWPDVGILLSLFSNYHSLCFSDFSASLLGDGRSEEGVVGVVYTSGEGGCEEEVEEDSLGVEPRGSGLDDVDGLVEGSDGM